MSDTPRMKAAQRIESECKVKEIWRVGCQLECELNAANQRIKRLEEAVQERDKEWFQVIESILGFHPVSMTEALRIGIERIKKQRQRIKRLEEAGGQLMMWLGGDISDSNRKLLEDAWREAKEAKP